MDKNYVVVKLVSDETLMATFAGEDAKYIKVEKPVLIKTVMVDDISSRERVIAVPYCQFSDDFDFVLEKSHVIYIKKLHKTFIEHYKQFAEVYETAIVPSGHEELDFEEELTVEDIQRKIAMLEALAGIETPEEEEEQERNYVQGNKTIH